MVTFAKNNHHDLSHKSASCNNLLKAHAVNSYLGLLASPQWMEPLRKVSATQTTQAGFNLSVLKWSRTSILLWTMQRLQRPLCTIVRLDAAISLKSVQPGFDLSTIYQESNIVTHVNLFSLGMTGKAQIIWILLVVAHLPKESKWVGAECRAPLGSDKKDKNN